MKTLTLTLLLLLVAGAAWSQTLPPPMNQADRADFLRRIQARRNGATNNPANPTRPLGAPIQPGPGGPVSPNGPGGAAAPGVAVPTPFTNPNAAAPAAAPQEEMIAPGTINFEGVDVNQVLDVYAQLVNRTLLRATLPQASITLKTQTPLTRTEAIEALKSVLGMNNITLIDVGDKFVKVSSTQDANGQGGPIDTSSTTNLPELGSYVTHVVQLRYVKPSEMLPIIQPFAKLQNSILPIDSNGILVLRDFAENVKRMLEMIRGHPHPLCAGGRHCQRVKQPRRQRRQHGELWQQHRRLHRQRIAWRLLRRLWRSGRGRRRRVRFAGRLWFFLVFWHGPPHRERDACHRQQLSVALEFHHRQGRRRGR